MADGLDLSRVKARCYRAQWRFIIDCPPSFANKSFYYAHYMGSDDCLNKPSRWSRFISQIMAMKLSRVEVKEILPEIREVLPIRAKLVDIHAFLVQHNAPLARSLFDVAVVFDNASHDLKSYIVVCFGVLPNDLQEFLDTQRRAA